MTSPLWAEMNQFLVWHSYLIWIESTCTLLLVDVNKIFEQIAYYSLWENQYPIYPEKQNKWGHVITSDFRSQEEQKVMIFVYSKHTGSFLRQRSSTGSGGAALWQAIPHVEWLSALRLVVCLHVCVYFLSYVCMNTWMCNTCMQSPQKP